MNTIEAEWTDRAFHEKFYQLSLDLFCVATPEGYFKSVNPAFSRKLGYKVEELINIPFLDLIHPADVAKTAAIVEELEAGSATTNFRNRYRCASGEYITVSWSANIDAETGLIYAVGRDVSKETNLFMRLSQIENGLSENSIFAETDARGVITKVNDKFCDISGYTREELIGRTHRIVSSGHHDSDFFNYMWRTISAKNIWSGVIKNKKKDGTFYYVQTMIIPITNLEGQIANYLAIRQDITDSIDHESLLQKTLMVLNETGAIARVGGWELDIATGELTWTDETFNILEVEKKSDQKPVLPEGLQLFIPEHQTIVANAVERCSKSGEPYSLEVKARTAKGNELWVYTNGKANYKDGKVVTLSGTIQDIDKRKLAEIKYNNERQKSIQNAKLASLGELAASMAHEINNPLGVINGYAELIGMKPDLTEDIRTKVEVIQKSGHRIAHIVQSLKKFSRSDEEEKYTISSLKAIVLEALALTMPRVKSENIVLIAEDLDDGQIVCSDIEIEQVLVNLINNAVDAVQQMPEKWIKLQLRNEGGNLRLRVSDSGGGIPKHIQYKIFEPFFTTKKPGKGTGLGLSIIRGILDDHQASIDYEEYQGNTSFVLRFPEAQQL